MFWGTFREFKEKNVIKGLDVSNLVLKSAQYLNLDDFYIKRMGWITKLFRPPGYCTL